LGFPLWLIPQYLVYILTIGFSCVWCTWKIRTLCYRVLVQWSQFMIQSLFNFIFFFHCCDIKEYCISNIIIQMYTVSKSNHCFLFHKQWQSYETMKSTAISWDVMLYSLIEGYCLGDSYCLHIQGCSVSQASIQQEANLAHYMFRSLFPWIISQRRSWKQFSPPKCR
jgi:hypothetical protein